MRELSYSPDACVAAVRDYYDFLTKMYLNKSDIIKPPEGGWPAITADNLRGLGKTDQVISLLSHLPYICAPDAQGAPWCCFADWEWASHVTGLGLGVSGEDLKVTSERVVFTTNAFVLPTET